VVDGVPQVSGSEHVTLEIEGFLGKLAPVLQISTMRT
jgi:hypothetical protein